VGKKTGRNPTDRGKRGVKRSLLTDGRGVPPGAVIDGANRNDHKLGSVENQIFRIRRSCFKFAMDRFVLTDAQWAKMEPHCRGKKSDPGRSGADNRRFVEAVLWIARTGSPWRDLPAAFGRWNTVFKRYRDWVKADVFKRLFDAASDEPDMEYAMVDATIVKVHRHGQGAKGGLRARPSAAPRAA
jgi:transposase